jgi:hypothetical protein
MIRVLVAAWMSLAFSSVTFAQAKPAAPVTAAPAPEIKTKPDQARVLTGKVLSVDAKMGRLTLKLTDKEIKLITDSKSTKAALEKLKVGDTARVFEKGGKLIAASPIKTDSKTKAAQ